jgi:fatty-acyl-CoA synthase
LFRDRSALVFGARDWSFNALDRAADRVAGHFSGLGLRTGDRIAAYGRNSDAYFIAWLACVRGGFVHVPVNYALTGEELSYIVRQSGSRLVLTGAGMDVGGIDVAVLPLQDLIAVALDANALVGPEPELDDDSLGQIV